METEESVLIVDDDGSARTLLARVLRGAGYKVVQADSGDGALALARSTTPSALILEVQLPVISGYEVCHALKAERGNDLPVLFLSGERSQSCDRIAGLLLGADDFLSKPFAAGEILARLSKVIRRSRSTAPGLARRLTKRELEVLELMGEGLRHEEIGRRLFISPKTVATHVEHILSKLDVRSKTQAIALAFREEILRPTPPSALKSGASGGLAMRQDQPAG